MLNYAQMLERIDLRHSALLLGNGFSRAWDDRIFAYDSLLKAANFGEHEERIRQLFTQLGTSDFERVTNRLRAARDLLTVYGNVGDLPAVLNAAAEAIKRALLEVIAAKHPDVPSRVTREQYIAVRRFISPFARIYSINYDLLLYWAINQRELDPPGWETNDGFLTGRAWANRDQQKVFFLHGALHLYQSEEGTKKLAFENGRTIIDAVRGNLENDIFPLYVSESSSEEKRAKITGNPYLDFCLRQLTLEEDLIVVVGHAFSETDQHIFDAINASRVGRVYVGLYRDPDSPANARTRGNATRFLHQKGRDVQFFDTETAPIWRQLEERGPPVEGRLPAFKGPARPG